MILVVRKSKLVMFCGLIFFMMYSLGMSDMSSVTTVSGVPAYDKVVVIDAGHGYPDGGAVGKGGTIEKDINLKIATKLQSLLERSGAMVVVTRSDDNSIADENLNKIRDIKLSDMQKRKDFRDEYGADIFVSIHMNTFPQSISNGAQVFYSKGPKGAKELGESIQKELISICDPSNTRKAKEAEDGIYLLKGSTIPAVIVECGFLSNGEEEKKLNTEEYQSKLAWGIYSGIQKYFEQ